MEPPQSRSIQSLPSSLSYSKPEWSCNPPNDKFALEVIKSGVSIEDIPLRDREFFRIGRQPDIVDISMDHASISRLHAVLNFHKDGSLHIYDNKSANGTFLNKQRLLPHKYYKINIGDIIKFGESSRLNVLKGEIGDSLFPGDEDFKVEQLRTIVIEKAIREKREKEKQEEGATWGIMDDPEENDNNNEAPTSQPSSASLKFENGKLVIPSADEEYDERFRSGDGAIHSRRHSLPAYLQHDKNYDRKHGKLFEASIDESLIKTDKDRELEEKIRKKERKIQNMQEENRRIFLKEHQQDDGLTTGQQAVITRNDKVIAELITEVKDMVKRLEQKYSDVNVSSQGVDGGAIKKRTHPIDDEEDDNTLYDTSQITADVSTNWRLKKKLNKLSTTMHDLTASLHGQEHSTSGTTQSFSYKEIKESVDRHQSHMKALEMSISTCNQEIASLSTQMKSVDDVTAVIHENRRHELKAKLSRLVVELEEAAIKMKQLNRLLSAAAPTLMTSSATTSSSASTTFVSSNIVEIQAPMDKLENRAAGLFDAKDEEQVLSKMDQFMQEQDEHISSTQTESVLSASKREAPPLSTSTEEGHLLKKQRLNTENSLEKTSKTVKGPIKPSSAIDNSEVRQMTDAAVRQGIIKSSQVLQSGEMIWIPPSKQKGDGKTSLNEKLGY